MKTRIQRPPHLRGPVLAALLASGLAFAAAAADPVPAPGTLLRIRPGADAGGIMSGWTPTFRANLLRASSDSLWVVPVGAGAPRSLALADVRLEVRTGRSHVGGALAGAAMGVFLGLAAGTAVALIENAQGRDDEFAAYSYIVYPAAGAAIGVPVGLFAGAVHGVDRWKPLRLP